MSSVFEKLPTDGVEVKLKLRSVITAYDLPDMTYGPDLSLPEDDAEELLSEFMGDGEDGPQKLEIVTTATVCEKDGRVTITYDDSEILGNPKSLTQVTFMKDEPGYITVIRSGAFSSILIVEQGRHNQGEYKMGPYAIPVTIFGRRVINTVSDSEGILELDFVIELSGSDTQRTRMKFTLSK